MYNERTVKDSYTETTHLVMGRHINGYGRLFGGFLMQWIDETAVIVARRHCGRLVTTACVDNLVFKEPAYDGDTIVITGRLTYVGRTSMEIRLDVYVENLNGSRKTINKAYVVMVAVDENGNKVKVPRLKLETDDEKEEWISGEKRYVLRKQRTKYFE